MERTHPPREALGALVEGAIQVAVVNDQLKVLIDAFRVWPQGLQFEVRTIEDLDLHPGHFDLQSLTGETTGNGLQISVRTRTSVDDEWTSLPVSESASETSSGGTHRCRHITVWISLDITSAPDIEVAASWPAAAMNQQSLELPGDMLVKTLRRTV